MSSDRTAIAQDGELTVQTELVGHDHRRASNDRRSPG